MKSSKVSVRQRMSAKKINEQKPQPREMALNMTGANTPAPMLYGRWAVPGLHAGAGVDGSRFVVRVIWGVGEFYSVKPYIGGLAVPAGVRVRTYRGTTYQGVDSWMAAAIPGYADDCILHKPSGDVGLCYSVFSFPSGYTQGFECQADCYGKIIHDPDSTSTGDPFRDLVGFEIHFTGSDGSAAATDTSTHAHTVVFHGDADIQGNQLDLDGTGDAVRIADHASLEFGSEPWTIEIRCTPSTVGAGSNVLLEKDDSTTNNRGFRLLRDANDLLLYLSSNGTSYNIANSVTVGTNCFSAGVEADVKVEFSGREYIVYVDDDEVYRLESSLTVFDNNARWGIGGQSEFAPFPWTGKIRSVRTTFGAMRYGAPVSVTNTPFSDSGTFTSGNVYSDNPALIFNDIATSTLYGMGASTLGLDDARTWCDDEIATAVARSRLGLYLSTPRKTEEVLDLVAEYGDFQWCWSGSDILMIPDQPATDDNPTGLELVHYGDFSSDSGWTIDGDFSISGGVLTT